MAERLIQIVVPAARADQMRELIRSAGFMEMRQDSSDSAHMFTVHLPAEKVESLLDPIEAAFGHTPGFHAFVLAIEAALPRPPEPEKPPPDNADDTDQPRPALSRVSREELYSDLNELARVTPVYIAMVILSTIVAAIGLSRNNAAVVIGAMVMAPLLGPNMALSLATTLGDSKLASRAGRTSLLGFLVATVIALLCGLLLNVDVASAEIVGRTYVAPSDIAVALAAGVAGALAFTTGVPSSLVGVMVAVALLPPLVVCAMLIVNGLYNEALGALLLLMCNVVSINLAGVATFLARGVSPRTWWDTKRSKRMTKRALAVWITLLIIVAALIVFSDLSREL